ncbi:MAG: beta-N-acetylhexosaminidase [Luminiphilus sp.]|nr:beta-N-acetylhexosaminidase [Luminiphilus sp.]
MTPAIFGIQGQSLTASERDFFKDSQPFGFILFGRNVAQRDQLRALTDDLRSLTGRDQLPILIDQEGGRVARMQAPQWPVYPPAAIFEAIYAHDPSCGLEACALNFEALALDLSEVGITVTCAPVLDVPIVGAHDVIGDRAFSQNPEYVAKLGEACLVGLRAGGVEGVIKHIPGHGRSAVDSHEDLPRVTASDAELASDLLPFRALSGALMAMTAHVIFDAWDADQCATLSPSVIDQVIRKKIGFDGLLMSDDLDMKALSGEIGELAAASQRAGCDVVLNCWAKMTDMVSIAEKLSAPSLESQGRMSQVSGSLASVTTSATLSQRQVALIERRDALMLR